MFVRLIYNGNTSRNNTLSRTYQHEPEVWFIKVEVKNGKELILNEIKFWNLPPSEFTLNFYERYYGRSFKYYSLNSSLLADVYTSKPSQPVFKWNASINSSLGVTYVES